MLQVVHHPATVRAVDLCSSPCVWPRGIITLGGARLLLTEGSSLVPRSLSPPSPRPSPLAPGPSPPEGGGPLRDVGMKDSWCYVRIQNPYIILRTNTKSVYCTTSSNAVDCCPVDRTQFTKSGLTWRIRFDKQALLKTYVLLVCY